MAAGAVARIMTNATAAPRAGRACGPARRRAACARSGRAPAVRDNPARLAAAADHRVRLRQFQTGSELTARLRRESLDGDKRWHLAVQVFQAARRHRTTGHAAEMAFFAVLTLVPSTVAVGSALGLSERLVGSAVVVEAENAASTAVRALMGPQLADKIITP